MWSLERLAELEEEMNSTLMFEAFYAMYDEREVQENTNPERLVCMTM